jgi:hypothetical protein
MPTGRRSVEVLRWRALDLDRVLPGLTTAQVDGALVVDIRQAERRSRGLATSLW